MEYSVGQQVAPGLIVVHENTLEQLRELERLQSENATLRIEAGSATDEWRKASANYDSATERRIKAEREVEDFKAQRAMTVARLGGIVEGNPTANHNYLQRVDELRGKESQIDDAQVRIEMLIQSVHDLRSHFGSAPFCSKEPCLSTLAYLDTLEKQPLKILPCSYCGGSGILRESRA